MHFCENVNAKETQKAHKRTNVYKPCAFGDCAYKTKTKETQENINECKSAKHVLRSDVAHTLIIKSEHEKRRSHLIEHGKTRIRHLRVECSAGSKRGQNVHFLRKHRNLPTFYMIWQISHFLMVSRTWWHFEMVWTTQKDLRQPLDNQYYILYLSHIRYYM